MKGSQALVPAERIVPSEEPCLAQSVSFAQSLHASAEIRRLDFSCLAEVIQHCSSVRHMETEAQRAGLGTVWGELRELLRFSQTHWLQLALTTGYQDLDNIVEVAKALSKKEQAIFALYADEPQRLLAWARVILSPNQFPHVEKAPLSELAKEARFADRNFYYVGPMVVDRAAYRALGVGEDPTLNLLNLLRAQVPEGLLISRIAVQNPRSLQTFCQAGFEATNHVSEIDGKAFRWVVGTSELIGNSARALDALQRTATVRRLAEGLGLPLAETGAPILVTGKREIVVELARDIAAARPARQVVGLIELVDRNVYEALEADPRKPSSQGNLSFVAMNADYWFWIRDWWHQCKQMPSIRKWDEDEPKPLEIFAPQAFGSIVAEGRAQGLAPDGCLVPHHYFDFLARGGEFFCVLRQERAPLADRLEPGFESHVYEYAGLFAQPWRGSTLWSGASRLRPHSL